MTSLVQMRSRKKGLPAGSLVYIGDRPFEQARVTVINFTESGYEQKLITKLDDCVPESHDEKTVTWIQIEGLSDTETIKEIGKLFNIHTLWLEDVLNTDHRPHAEELDDFTFMILKAVEQDPHDKSKFYFDQISLFLGDNFVISFQDRSSDIFDSVKNRIKNAKGKIRKSKADYLFYSLLDAIVDSYFSIIERLGKETEKLEALITHEKSDSIPSRVSHLKNNLLSLRKAARPLKFSLKQLCRSKGGDFDKKTKIYLQDVHEHMVDINESIENYRDMLSGLLEIYKSSTNQKLNEIMKVLTMISTIFIPLSFVVGIYGMNFKYMPELDWKVGYFVVWFIIIAMSVGMLYFFKKKKWF